MARQFGVRAGMPGFIASRLCPQLEIVPLNFDKYTKESRVLSSILSEYDPNLSMGSLDEAYIDLTQYAAIRSSSGVCLLFHIIPLCYIQFVTNEFDTMVIVYVDSLL